jgi:predicted RNA-binding Zn ribbon-like protein
LRESIFKIFSAVAAHRVPPLKDVRALNAALRNLSRCAIVLSKNGRFSWVWRGNKNTIDRLLWEIVRSAVELLTSNGSRLVRQCAADDCDWLFIDSSRSHNRRWCEMKTCGNRHKARAYYHRKIAHAESAQTLKSDMAE